MRNLANDKPEIIYQEILTQTEMTAMERKEEEEEIEESQSWCTIL